MSRNLQIRFAGQDLGLTTRQVTNWNKEGIFIDQLVEGKRKEFDFVEGVWVRSSPLTRQLSTSFG